MSQDPRLFKATDVLLQGMDQYIDPLEKQDALYDLATTLYEISGNNQRTSHAYDYVAAERAREFIHASLYENISLDDIEKMWDETAGVFHAIFDYCLVQVHIDI